jgi:glycosyltransferase involved in cell wall biosynthesis
MIEPSFASPKRPRILYVVTDDWFFVSHFLPIARAAKKNGFDVMVAARMDKKQDILNTEGFLTFDTVERRQGGIFASAKLFFRLLKLLFDQKPDLVHCIALRSILIGGLARKLTGGGAMVLAATGLGFLSTEAASKWKQLLVFGFCRWIGRGTRTQFLFENTSDGVMIGLSKAKLQTSLIVGGAGVDTQALQPAPLPAAPPFRLALVARMIWSKGVDLAIAAVKQARSRGVNVTLDLYGEPDPGNPASMQLATLREFDGTEGIHWHGRRSDINTIWASHHLCVLPSRGGEGLPRSLLEAAACGRGIITTNVPGCRDFVRNGIDGLVVEPDNIAALCAAIIYFTEHLDEVSRFSIQARQRIIDGFTEEEIANDVLNLYLGLSNISK